MAGVLRAVFAGVGVGVCGRGTGQLFRTAERVAVSILLWIMRAARAVVRTEVRTRATNGINGMAYGWNSVSEVKRDTVVNCNIL